jgi:2-polyprenyl-6-methoxyphenol hydroxylase-like FAD-dependent oxidoreductase
MGVVGDLITQGRECTTFSMYALPSMKRIVNFHFGGVETAFPFMLSIPQRDTETILERHLEQKLGVRVERSARLDRFEQDDAGVTSVVVHASGAEETIRTSWIVGCDGAHSTVRAALGMPFEGSTYEQKIIQADVHVDIPIQVAGDEVAGFVSAKGLVGLFPLPGEKRYRMLVPSPKEADLEPTLETFQRYMAELGPPGATVSDPIWMVGFRIHCRMVPRYREGRVFIAGDACHIHSPAGGQGMNTGIQDAYNLAWKLALVQKGKGRPALLESYESERKPVAAAVLATTDKLMRQGLRAGRSGPPIPLEILGPALRFISGLGLVQERVSRGISMLEVGYPESPIVGQDQVSVLNANVLSSKATESPSLRDWLDFGGGPAPGTRALDGFADEEDPSSVRVFDLFKGTHHTLLLLDGAAPTEEGYKNLGDIAARVTERYGDRIKVHIVVPSSEEPAALQGPGSVVLDPKGTIHKSYGARSECLYLVRPDGYVGYRCQPADMQKLTAYLERVFA